MTGEEKKTLKYNIEILEKTATVHEDDKHDLQQEFKIQSQKLQWKLSDMHRQRPGCKAR